MKPKETDLAWAAGFFEGEGCVTCHGSNGRTLQLVLVNTDLERLKHFQDVVGVGTIRERTHDKPKRRKAIYQWAAYGQNAVDVFGKMEPWLGSRRIDRFRELVAVREAYIEWATAARPCKHCGTVFRPRWGSQALKTRYCSPKCASRGCYQERAEKQRLLNDSTRAA